MKPLSLPRIASEGTRFFGARKKINALLFLMGLNSACHSGNPGILEDQRVRKVGTTKIADRPSSARSALNIDRLLQEAGVPNEWLSQERKSKLAALLPDERGAELGRMRQVIRWEENGLLPMGTAQKFASGNYRNGSFEWLKQWIADGRDEHEFNQFELSSKRKI